MSNKKKKAAKALAWILAAMVLINVLIGVATLLLRLFGWSGDAVSMATGAVLLAYMATILWDAVQRGRLSRRVRRVEDAAYRLGVTRAPGESDLAFVERVDALLRMTGSLTPWSEPRR